MANNGSASMLPSSALRRSRTVSGKQIKNTYSIRTIHAQDNVVYWNKEIARMKVDPVKEEIVQLLDQIPDYQLLGVLEYLRELSKLSELDQEVGDNLSKIMFEDDNLLKRLAQ